MVYDANVLYPAPLRDLFMHLALTGLFRARWTEEIHQEWMRNVLANRPDISQEQLERTRDLMNRAVLNCLVIGYEELYLGGKFHTPRKARPQRNYTTKQSFAMLWPKPGARRAIPPTAKDRGFLAPHPGVL